MFTKTVKFLTLLFISDVLWSSEVSRELPILGRNGNIFLQYIERFVEE